MTYQPICALNGDIITAPCSDATNGSPFIWRVNYLHRWFFTTTLMEDSLGISFN